MGQEIPNPPEDSAKKLVCLLNFLMPPFQLGNLPGEAERFDHKGNLKIVKEELVSDSSKSKSESDEVEIIAVNPQGTTELSPGNLECMAKARSESEEKGDRDPEPEKIEDKEPVQSTSTGITKYVTMDPVNLRNIPGHIEIDGLTMAKFFAEHMSTDLTIKTKAGKITAIWIPDGQEAQEPEIMDQDWEPDTTDPTPKNKVNSEAAQHLARLDNRRIEKALDALDQRLGQQLGPYPVTDQSQEDIIQILDDHIAVSPNPAQASSEKETDSGLEEPVTCEREEKESDNEFENQEKDVVATSTSDQEEIIIDPITIETYSEEGVQTLARKMGDKDEKEVQGLQEEEASNEYNSNQEEEKVMLELPTNRLQSPHQPSQQLLLHKVPIRFPVPSNLMESIETLIFINDTLISLTNRRHPTQPSGQSPGKDSGRTNFRH